MADCLTGRCLSGQTGTTHADAHTRLHVHPGPRTRRGLARAARQDGCLAEPERRLCHDARCTWRRGSWQCRLLVMDGIEDRWAALHFKARRDFARRREQAQCLGDPKPY